MAAWREDDGQLVRDYEFKDFAEAMTFVFRVGELAEEVNHHPDILVHGWNKVRLTLSTHSAGGLTDADRALADAVVRVPIRGRAESLNLSAAAAVCLYATARAQREESRRSALQP